MRQVRLASIGITFGLLVATAALATAGGQLLVRRRPADERSTDAQPSPLEVVIDSSTLPSARREPLTVAAGGGASVTFSGLPPGRYTIRVSSPGGPLRAAAEAEVREDATTVVDLPPLAALAEDVVVQGETLPSSTLTTHVTLDLVERVPVTRDYRGYPQLVLGVNVVPNPYGLETTTEPASKAGNNYQDRGAGLGSRDNTYHLDGFDITGFGSGVGDLLFDNEVIQEEEVITSGVPVDYDGGAGFVANVVTKAGSDAFSGSANFYRQDPSWDASWKTADTRLQSVRVDQYDAGLTLGGPAIPHRLFFFAAAQQRESWDDVQLSTSASPVPRTGTFTQRRRNAFLKTLWQPDESSLVTAQGYYEPRRTTGARDVNVPPNWYSSADDSTRLLQLQAHTTAFADWLPEVRLGSSDQRYSSVPQHPELGPSNTLLFPPGVVVPAYQRDLGSSGGSGTTEVRKDQLNVAVTRFAHRWGEHALHAGYQYQHWQEDNFGQHTGGVVLTSLAPGLAGLTFGQARDLSFLPQSELDFILRSLQADPTSAFFRAVDANHDGVVTEAELEAMRLDSRAGNRDGVNFLRDRDVSIGHNDVRQKVHVAFAEDEWRSGRLSVRGGVRVERRRYIASDDSTILEMDPVWLPRLGATWQLDRRSQVLSFAYGVYADPLRSSMLRFAGNLSGSVTANEVFLAGDWFAYRLRGSPTRNRDAGFAPNLQNETEEEASLTYMARPAPRLAFTAQAFYRRDRHIIEDYDPALYFDPAAAGDLALTPETFGYGPEGPTDVNYFLADLVGAKRRTYGLDLGLQREWSDRWGGSLQYSWRDAKGNSNSDGAADLQGDFLALDPRQPYMWGWLPGTIEHQLKAFGSVRMGGGVELGALWYWNDGSRFTEATIFRPTGSDIYYNYQLPDGSYVRMGNRKQPAYSTLDLRVRYTHDLARRLRGEIFLDVFNALDDQKAYLLEQGHNDPEFQYLQPRAVLEPRHYQLGIRLSF